MCYTRGVVNGIIEINFIFEAIKGIKKILKCSQRLLHLHRQYVFYMIHKYNAGVKSERERMKGASLYIVYW